MNSSVTLIEQPVASAALPAPMRRGWQMFLLVIASLAASYAQLTVNPIQEAMRVALGITDNQMALLQGPALALPMVVAAIPLGLIIDRYSRVRLLLIFAVSNLIGSVLTALAPTFGVLLAARGLVGLTAIAINPVTLSLIADLYEPTHRGRSTMLMGLSQTAGAAAAFALGGALLARANNAGSEWRSVMLWLTSPLIPVALAGLALREPRRTGGIPPEFSIRAALETLWRFRQVITPLGLGVVLVEIALGAPLVWTAPAFSRTFALQPDRIGAIMAIVMLVSGIVGPLGGGFLADFCQRTGGSRRAMIALLGLSLLSAPAGLFAIVPQVTSASVLLVIFMMLISGICVMGTTLFTIVIPGELRGLCMGLFAAATVLFSVGLAPVMVSALSGPIGGAAMIGTSLSVVCVMTCLAGAAAFAAGLRYFPAAKVPEHADRYS